MIDVKNKEISSKQKESSRKIKEKCPFTPSICENSIILNLKVKN